MSKDHDIAEAKREAALKASRGKRKRYKSKVEKAVADDPDIEETSVEPKKKKTPRKRAAKK